MADIEFAPPRNVINGKGEKRTRHTWVIDFEPEEWDRFAAAMRDSFEGVEERLNVEKAARAMIRALEGIAGKRQDSPIVEHVSNKDFRAILNETHLGTKKGR